MSGCSCQKGGAIEGGPGHIDTLQARLAWWKQHWNLPGTNLSIVGYSRAAYRTGFYIPELNIMLDAGPTSSKNPDHVFITHNHVDHVAGLPYTMFRQGQADHRFVVHGPQEAELHIKNYVSSMYELNSLTSGYDPYQDLYSYRGYTNATSFQMTLRKQLYEVDVVLCDHSVPTVSYCFSQVRSKLKEEYSGISGVELAKLKKSGTCITMENKIPMFAFVCDTTVRVLDQYPIIFQHPIIFIECTFLYPEELPNCEATKHIHWEHLYPYVQAHPNQLFVLIHFSLRYEDSEIIDFFEKEKVEKRVQNIKVWAGRTDDS